MNWSTNDLRAFAGIILLALAIITIFTKNETDTIKYVIMAMAGFLVGGQLLGNKKE